MAAQLAALFVFLRPSEETTQKTDQAELALYADPTYWLYGLLSFCAKSCEAKTAEAGGEPDFRTSKERKQDSSAPALEPTRNSTRAPHRPCACIFPCPNCAQGHCAVWS